MEKIPSIFGCMGVNILNYGIYRLDEGMKSYFYPLSIQIQKNNIRIEYATELSLIREIENGFELHLFDKKNNINKIIFTEKNLYLNLTIHNFIDIFEGKKDFLKRKLLKSFHFQSWTALAVYGYFRSTAPFSQEPYYCQIFPDSEEIDDLNNSIYLSIYQENIQSKYRNFTASIHFKANYNENLRDKYHLILIRRIEKALNIKIEHSEFASPSTFEKYTKRKFGFVGGIITNLYRNKITFSPYIYTHKNTKSKIYLIGDNYFPGQGIISSSMSGIIAWERSSNLKFRSLIKN